MIGSDSEGNVSNYVETEQVLEFSDGSISSYIQTRGSIPSNNYCFFSFFSFFFPHL